jgi:hypothetical protein
MLHRKGRMKNHSCAAPTAIASFVQLTQGFRVWAKLFRSSGARVNSANLHSRNPPAHSASPMSRCPDTPMTGFSDAPMTRFTDFPIRG